MILQERKGKDMTFRLPSYFMQKNHDIKIYGKNEDLKHIVTV
jgi:hypothetical protein